MQHKSSPPLPKSSTPRWLVPVILGAVLLVAIAVVFNAMQPSRATQEASNAPGLGGGIPIPTSGTRIEPPRQLNNFTLTNQDGQPISLSDFAGKPTLIYFGYTYCPDVCPTSLADMARAQKLLGDLGTEVNFVMVSVDGERDTSDVLKRYIGNFSETFVGLTAPPSEIRKIAPDYGVFFQKNQVAGTSAAYLVDHSTAIYLVDPQGRLHTIYGYGIPPTVLEQDLRQMLGG
ncbi:MAG: SCO family protein [Chloroflexaceae bacterium]|nr:SCO family protein [Chloroflexaceae bacterium]